MAVFLSLSENFGQNVRVIVGCLFISFSDNFGQNVSVIVLLANSAFNFTSSLDYL